MKLCLIFLFLTIISTTLTTTRVEYCKISPQNTMCLHEPYKYGPSCPTIIPSPVTEHERNFIVKLHNNLRSKVALGLEYRGSSCPQPKAANMRALTWDDELALMADTHVRQCIYSIDTNRDVPRFPVGQSVGSRKTWPQNEAPNWTETIMQWFDLVSYHNATHVSSFTSTTTPEGKRIGVYTALVWANTYKIGCSVVNWLESEGWYTHFYACNYGPAGNVLYQSVYMVGSPGSACPDGTEPDSSRGLCI